MLNIQIVSKETHQVLDLKGSTDVKLVENSVVIINVKKEDIASTERVGNALVILLKSGEKISIENFFASHSDNDVVLKDDQNKLFLLELNQTQDVLETVNYISINDIEPLLYHDANIEILPWVIGGALGIGAIAAIANNDSSSDKKNGDVTPPNQPLVHSTNGRLITGTAEAGSTVNITDSSGKVIGTTTAGPDGKFTFTPTTPIPDGTALKVTAVDASGNVSPPAQVIVDSTAPAQPIVNPTDGSRITGTAEAGSTVNITDSSGKVIGTTTAGPDGKFTFTPTTPIPDGTALKVTAVDASGNISPPAQVIVDSTAPAQPIVNPTDGSPITGTAEAGSTVNITDSSGKVIGTTTAGPDGKFTFTPTTPIPDGTALKVTAVDASGNISPPAQVIVDSTAPAQPIVNPTDGSPITGTAEAGSTVNITDSSGKVIGTTTAGPDGKFTFTPTTPIPDGTALKVTAVDASGNVSPPAQVIVDSTAPAQPIVNPTDGSPITGTAEAGSTVNITDSSGKVIGTTTAGPDGKFTFTPITPIPDGTALKVTAVDASGNVSPPAQVIVDGTAPAQPIVNPTDGSPITGTAEAGSTVNITDSSGKVIGTTTAGPDGKFTFTPTTPIPDGTALKVTAVDASGNVSPPAQVIVDSTAPAQPIVNPTDGSPITGTAEAGSTVNITDSSGKVIGTTTAGPDGKFTFTPTTPIPDGTALKVTAVDASGNVSPPAQVIVDSTAPAQPIVNPTDGSPITGTAEAGSTVNITDSSGKVIGTTTAGPDGKFTFTPTTPIPDGTALKVTAVDASGNVSPPAQVIVDSTAPAQPIVNPTDGSPITGTAEAGSTVNITDSSGKVIGTTTAGPDGKFTFTPTTPIPDGTALKVTAVDASGNVSPPAQVIVDSTAPAQPIVNPTDGSPITGTAEVGSTVNITDSSGKVIGTTTAGPDGKFTFTPTTPIPDGTTLKVTAVDASGNVSPPAVVIVDSTAPTVIISMSDTILTIGESALVMFSFSEIVKNFGNDDILVSNGTLSPVSSNDGGLTWTAIFTPNANFLASNNKISVIAGSFTDITGNVGIGGVGPNFAINTTTAPAAPVVNVTGNPDGSVSVSGTAEPNSNIEIRYPDGSTVTTPVDSSGNYGPVTSAINQPTGTVSGTVTDASGNTGPSTSTNYVDNIDPAAPVVNVTGNPDGSVSVSGTAEPNSNIEIRYPDGSTITTAVDSSGNYGPVTSAINQPTGTVSGTVTDASGNTGPSTSTNYVDNIDPVAPVVNVTGNPDGSVSVSGTAEPNSNIEIRYPDGSTVTTAVDSSGNYGPVTSAINQPTGTVSGTVTDASGNTGPSTSTNYVDNIDPAAPVVNVTGNPDGSVSVSGTAEPNSNIEIRYPDGSTVTTAVDSSGNYGPVTSAINQPTGTVSGTVTDASGNTGPSTSTNYVDNIDPAAPVVNVTGNPDGSVSVSGTAEPNSNIEIRYPDGSTITTAVDSSGNYGPVTSAINQPTGTVSGTVTDASGNTGPSTSTNYVDNIDPVAPVVNVTGNPDGSVSVSGTAEPNSNIEIRYPDGSTVTTAVDSSGNYGPVTSAINQPTGTVSGTVTDASGNTGPSTSTNYVDNIDPAAPVVNVTGNPDGSVSVSGTAEPNSNIEIRYPDGSTVTTAVDSSGNYGPVTSAINQPTGTVSGTVTDASGNTGPSTSTNYVDNIDPAAPVVNVTGNPDGSVSVSGTAEPNSNIEIRYPDGSTITTAVDSSGNYGPVTSAINQPTGTVSGTVTDASGNTGPSTSTNYVDNIDPAAPVVNVTGNPDGSVSVSGTAEPNSNIEIRYPDGSTITTAVDSSGNYGPVTSAINQPTGTVSGTVTDASGNTGLSTSTNYVDNIVPTQIATITGVNDNVVPNTGHIDNAGYSNDTSPQILGEISAVLAATEVVAIYRNDGNTNIRVGTATITGTGTTWVFDDSGLSDGISYTYTARVEDGAGNQANLSNAYVLNIDTTPPSANTTINIVSITDDTGLNTTDFITNDTSLTINGTVGTLAVGETAQISIDGGLNWIDLTVNAGIWSYEDTRTLLEGEYTYQVRVVDAAGNIGQSDDQIVSVDLTGPSASTLLNITSISTDSGTSSTDFITNDQSITVNGVVGTLAADEQVQISVDGINWVNLIVIGGTWSYQDPRVLNTDGDYTYQVRIVDIAGNIGATDSQTIQIDTAAPTQNAFINSYIDLVAPNTGLMGDNTETNDTTPTLIGSVSAGVQAGDILELYENGTWIASITLSAGDTTWTYSLSGLSNGVTYQYTVRIVDIAGNTGVMSPTFTLTVDTMAPTTTVSIDSYTDDVGLFQGNYNNNTTTDDTTPLLKGTLSSALSSGEVVEIYDDSNALLGVAVVDATGTGWSFQLPSLSNGSYTYYAVVVDAAGNHGTNSANFTLTIDTLAPTQTTTIDSFTDDLGTNTGDYPSGSHTDDTAPRLNGTISGGALAATDVVLVYEGTTQIGVATLNASRTAWTFDVAGLVNGDNKNYTAVVADAAGNLGTFSSPAFRIIVDNVAPTQTASITSYVDFAGPVIGIFGNGTTTDDTKPTLNGTLSSLIPAGTEIRIYEGSVFIGVAMTTGGTSWFFELPTLADPSTHTYTARVADEAGNESPASAPFTLTVDSTVLPEAININAFNDNYGENMGYYSSGSQTDDTSPELIGVLGAALNPGDKVLVYQVDPVLGTPTLLGEADVFETSWSYVLSGLSDGRYYYRAEVVNSFNSVLAQSNLLDLIVDTIAPTEVPSITVYNDTVGLFQGDFISGTTTDDTHALLKGTLDTALMSGESLHIHDNNGNLVGIASVTGTTWSLPLSLVTDGTYTYTAVVVDQAGNEGPESAAFTLILDTTPPTQQAIINSFTDDVIMNTGDYGSGSYTNDTLPVLNGTLNTGLGANEVLRIYEGSTFLGIATVTGLNWTFEFTNILSNGSHDFTARVMDAAGNQGPISNAFNLIVDTIATSQTANINNYIDSSGAVTGLMGSNTTTDDTTPTLIGAVTAGVQAGYTINLYQNDVLITSIVLANGQTSWSYTPNILGFGTYNYYVKVADQAGNEGTASPIFSLTVDATATLSSIMTDTAYGQAGNYSTNNDAVNTDLITRDSTPILNGTISRALEANEQVTISLDGGNSWIVVQTTLGATSWAYTPQSSGYTVSTIVPLQVRIENTVNGTHGSTTTTTYTVDLIAPSMTLSNPDFANPGTIDADGDKTILAGAVQFNSSVDGTAEVGSVVALINDINNDGIYTEGVDSVLNVATVAAGGTWNMSLSLTAGQYHLGYVIWDAAGNRSRLSMTSDVDVVNNLGNAPYTNSAFGTNATLGYGSSMVINTNGHWTFVNDQAVYAGASTTSYTTTALTLTSGTVSSYSFGDYNLDGNIDIIGTDSAVTSTAPIWTGIAGGGFTAGNVNAGQLIARGGSVFLDMDGDGYLDAVVGDRGNDSSAFLKNNSGVFSVYGRASGNPTATGLSTLTMDRENSAVDLNNDGKVDLALHATTSQSGVTGAYTLSLLLNSGSSSATGANWTETQVITNVFGAARADDSTTPLSMTWADFNGDGYLDLYLNTTQTGTSANSKIFLNNGGSLSSNGIAIANDSLAGEASVAVDWNGDGKMDAIEVDYTTGIANLYTNNGNVATGWATTQLADMGNSTLNGIAAADYDWDGDIDLLASFNTSTQTQLISNTNQVKDGTALHLRIVNAEGHNVYYGNTVQLFDSSGRLVSTQIINPQSGNWVNDGSALVNIFGLDPSQSYTVKLLANDHGVTTTYSWNVTPGSAVDAQVLTTTAVTTANATTLVGTGYNDTYVVSNVVGGTTAYNGGGGWNLPVMKGESKTWVASGGMDIIDFRNASTGVTVNLQAGTVSGWGTVSNITNVEGVRGSAQSDTLSGNAFDNIFEGRGGDDIINLGSNAGNDRLVYNLINPADHVTGGNGTDTINGFVAGSLAFAPNSDADIIDLSGLLTAYTGTAYVYFDAGTGSYMLDRASIGLYKYLQVSTVGNDTVISVDLAGTGNFTTPLLTLKNISLSLEYLLANGQLLLGSSTAALIHINAQTTTDTTPIVSGTIPYGLNIGEVLQITVNGTTYSTANNTVVVDPINHTWYVQLPVGVVNVGRYDVVANIVDANGSIIMSDASRMELEVLSSSGSLTPAWGNADVGNVLGGTTMTLGQNGLWSFFQTSTTSDVGTIYNSTGLNTYTNVSVTGGSGGLSGASFVDFNRDSFMDIFTNTSTGASSQSVWTTTDGINYNHQILVSGTSMWNGAVVAYDKTGDGYLDFAYGDTGGDSMTFITNTAGSLSLMAGGAQGRPVGITGNTDSEVSAVDLTNDGAVDVIQHTISSSTPTAGGAYALTLLTNVQSAVNTFIQTNIAGVFRTGAAGDPASATAMTWADFNNDGKMDLFLGAGRNAANTADSTVSRIYWNSGTGSLFGTASGTAGGQATYLSDTLDGGASVAVDWNHDGKMDIVELPRSGVSAVPNLYTNNGAGSFTQSTLGTAITGVNGALAVDYNWDGAVDVLAYKGGANTILLQNNNIVADGTSLHLRILDANGLNVYYGNTVQLYNSAGTLVASQILNPQSGVFGADGSGIVNFYGLNANDSYTAVLIKSVNGVSQDVGGSASLGGNSIENINLSWAGLTAGAAIQAYVLSGEATTNVANGKFIGTGYNDIFFATAGTDSYDGSGGTAVDLSGNSNWSATGGLDTVDYKLASSTALTIDLSNMSAQNTGFGTASFKNIEALAGGNGNDTFTGNTANNQFEGRGGNDTFNLANGGQDTLLYKVLLADATGGNGTDSVNGFKVGTVEATADARPY
ncbi:Ig-like domain-containing protein [Acinetobacter bereziniae]|nr:Ig-like domain-containing protein [Acinetobacter bereziniae]